MLKCGRLDRAVDISEDLSLVSDTVSAGYLAAVRSPIPLHTLHGAGGLQYTKLHNVATGYPLFRRSAILSLNIPNPNCLSPNVTVGKSLGLIKSTIASRRKEVILRL